MKTRIAILASLLLASCAVTPAARPEPAEKPPPHTRWARSYTVEEFEQEVRREDDAARAAEAQGKYYVRTLPTPAIWAKVRERHSQILAVWRYEPDGTDYESASNQHKLKGAGFALIDGTQRLIYLHEAIGYIATPGAQ
jgi:hypothetical protein